MISVVIPVYKAEKCLDELYSRLTKVMGIMSCDYELIFVEDCGGDGSWNIISTLSKKDSRVRGLQFSRNFGQHYGITAGIDVAQGDWVVVMDCDLQDRPEEIPNLYRKALEGYEVVLANRGKRSDPLLKRLASWAFYRVFNYLVEIDHDGRVGNFRIISRKVADIFKGMRERLRFFGGLIDWMGFPVAYVDVTHDERFFGESSYTYRKLFQLAMETIIAYTDKPLRLAVKLGFSISLLSMLYGCFIIYRAIFKGVPVAGWSSLIVSVYFLGGVVIAILGVIGIYVGRSFDEAKRRPLYIVSKTVGGGE